MYKVKAFVPAASNEDEDEDKKSRVFNYNGLYFKQATFTQDKLMALLNDLFTNHPNPITLSIRLEDFEQLGVIKQDVILEVTSE